MNQTGYIAAFLIIGFIVFVTLRGELPSYFAVIGLGNAQLPAASSGTSVGSSLASQSASATGGLSTVLPELPSISGVL